MKQISSTPKEFEAFSLMNNTVSDLDMGYNPTTKEFDLPSIEWDTYMGSYWVRFNTEEERTEALDKHTTEFNAWILNHRKEIEAKRVKRVNEGKRLQNLKTLGGQFPQLMALSFS